MDAVGRHRRRHPDDTCPAAKDPPHRPAHHPVANTVATLGLAFGCIIAGMLADRLGGKRVIFVGSVLLAICTYVFYTTIGSRPELLLPLYA
jgi:MFS family permease